jgi:hypothetical protein
MTASPIIAALAFAISAISLYFSRRSWRETYRPIIAARVATFSAGNVACCYNLLIENCGNRPAQNIQLRLTSQDDFRAALNPKARETPEGVLACFSEKAHIPVLANGASISAYFGSTATNEKDATWIPDSSFSVKVTYEGFDGVKYSSVLPLRISVGPSFTGWSWGNEIESTGKT